MLLWISLLLGQLGAIPLDTGVNLYVQDIVLVMTVIVAIMRYELLGKLRWSRLIRPVAVFVAVSIASLLFNTTVKGSLYLLRWIAYAVFYGVVLAFPVSASFWLWWLGSFGIALSIIGFVQFVWYPDLRNLWYLGWDPHYYRLFATLLDPNYVGILLVLTIFVLWFLGRRVWSMIAALALLLTFSRSSYLALIAGVSVSLLAHKCWKQWLFALLGILLVIVYVPKPGGETLSLDRYDSTVSRIQNWGQTIARIGQRPVFGLGWSEGKGVDSSLLFVGVTTGIAGLVSYLWLLSEQLRFRNILVLSSLGAVLAHSVFVNSLFYPWVMVWLWTIVGVAEKTNERR